jgi:NO-binding membrane sensor protein with MHYT domain/CheY-like chemotaxis protein/nitrogen-specific signal transduction histidine kinase
MQFVPEQMLHGSHDSALVGLSVLIAIAASYTALDLGGRIQAATGKACYAWLLTAALAMGGGIWSMHFVAMLAFRLPGMEVTYDVGLTLLSLIFPILVTALGFFVVRRKETGPIALATSGVFMGLGIVAMHYTGMAAMRMPATLSYDPVFVALSVLIAIGASVVALRLAFRNTALRQKVFGSVVMGLAIAGMHYTAMHAAIFHAHAYAGSAEGQHSFGQIHLALGVATATFLILLLALVAAIFDRRFAVLASREVAALREAQCRLEEAQAKLLQAQKMEALGQLTGGIAHDFNNLLAVVLANLELLRKRVRTDPQVARLLENAYEGAQRGAALTQRMLTFARRQELKPEAVDMPHLIRGMADLLRRTIGPGIQIETRFPADLPRAHVDAPQLELAILNLAVNARDAMPDGGSITIAADEEIIEENNALGLVPRAYIRLRVTDSGVGMDEPTLARALEPFFTTKGAGRGTGLGLSIVHGLAEQSGGRLVLRSRCGEGTTAEIWLPVSGEEFPRQAPMPAEALQSDRSHQRLGVLVVDDDNLVLAGTAAMLEDLGHTALEAASGEEALDLLRKGERIDLVVTDQVMPGMTGTELAAEIKAKWPQIPVMLATGYAELPSNLDPALVKLSKPFSQNTLGAAIAKCTSAPRARRTKVA